jgi:hypothetical protein
MLEQRKRARLLTSVEMSACAVELEAGRARRILLERGLRFEERPEPSIVTMNDDVVDEGLSHGADARCQLDGVLQRGAGGAGVPEPSIEDERTLDMQPRRRERLTGETRETTEQRSELRPATGRLERGLEPGERAGVIGDERERRCIGGRRFGRCAAASLEQTTLLDEEVGAHEGIRHVRHEVLDMLELGVDLRGLTTRGQRAEKRMRARSVLDERCRPLRRCTRVLDLAVVELGLRELEMRAHGGHRVGAAGERRSAGAQERRRDRLAFVLLEGRSGVEQLAGRRQLDGRAIERQRDDAVRAREHRRRARVRCGVEDRQTIGGDERAVIVLERAAVERHCSSIAVHRRSGADHERSVHRKNRHAARRNGMRYDRSTMRSEHRSLIVGLMGLALATTTAAACGGATPQEALDSQPVAGSTSGGTSGATSGGTSGATSGGTSGTTSGGLDASIDGAASCPPEVEPNDSRDMANVLAPTRCGAIQPNSESDFLTFELGAKTTSMQIKFDGKVQLKVEVGGQTVTLGNGNAPKVPFQKGQRYIIEIKATDRATSVPWRVDLIEN